MCCGTYETISGIDEGINGGNYMNYEYEQNQEIEFQKALKAIKDFNDAFSKLDNQHKNKLFQTSFVIATIKSCFGN